MSKPANRQPGWAERRREAVSWLPLAPPVEEELR